MQSLLQAAAPLLAPAFTLWGSPVTWIEILAFCLSLWMVVCNIRVQPLGWPLAILSSLLYALLFASDKLYGEAGLQLLFIVVAGWGWWQWLRGHGADGQALQVHRLSSRQRLLVLAATLCSWPLLGLLLHRLTDSDVPFLDALPTVGSIVGQFLLGRKLTENWPVWVAVNLVSIALFSVKGLWLTVILYALFTVMAMLGWRNWLRLQQGAMHAT
jgi:nicotinamide mononucleotide transporter